ncbi:MAG: ABC transporter permease [Armatimonadetes bacterium]|nr:ABC transporter permease [Armatimonadota bacterium]
MTGRYVLRRVLQIVPVVVALVVLNFLIITAAPGDPARAIAGEDAPADYLQGVRERYGLDRPVPVRLAAYMRQLARGDFGYSFAHNRPVLTLIGERLPRTLLLTLTALLLAAVVGTMLGAFSATRFGTWTDTVLSGATLVFYTLPVFWMALLVILVFGLWLRLLPTSGLMSVGFSGGGWALVLDRLRHLVLPVGTLTFYLLPTYFRLTRGSMIQVLGEEYITVARSKGLAPRTVYVRHALRNALLPTLTVIGVSVGTVMTGSLLTETVFSYTGLGRLMYEGVFKRDYPLMMGIFFFISVGVVSASLLTDIVYAWVDPRVRYD